MLKVFISTWFLFAPTGEWLHSTDLPEPFPNYEVVDGMVACEVLKAQTKIMADAGAIEFPPNTVDYHLECIEVQINE